MKKQNDKPQNKNSLSIDSPQLVPYWHPTKNGTLTPETIGDKSARNVWWKCEHGHEWQSTPHAQARVRICPYCSNRKPLPGFNDLGTTHPELAAQWHPTKNEELTPNAVSKNSHKKVWWLFPFDDPKTGKHFDFEWQASICSRVAAPRVPFLRYTRIFIGFNDLSTTNPSLALQWNIEKNGELTPRDVSEKSKKAVWWKCEHGHEWMDTPAHRNLGYGCPFCREEEAKSNYWKRRKAIVGVDDFATTHPELAAQWHPTRNRRYKNQDLTAQSTYEIWWLYPYDDPNTNKHFDFVWRESVRRRVLDPDCPFLKGTRKWPGFNYKSDTNIGFLVDIETKNLDKESPTSEDFSDKFFV